MSNKLRVLDLFSGIGGFSLGLERAGGFETVAFCEIEEFPRKVLAKHWPGMPIYEDVRTLTADTLARDGIGVDVICGGFPCQDISLAGKGAGLAGERSGLWREYARLVGELRPRFVIVENVAALLSRGLADVLGDLASLGYDAEWHCIPASAVGAPHRRDRVWILANSECAKQRQNTVLDGCMSSVAGETARERVEGSSTTSGRGGVLANSARQRCTEAGENIQQSAKWPARGGDVSNANTVNAQRLIDWSNGPIIRREQIERQARLCRGTGGHHTWEAEPNVGRLAHGVPDRVGQLKAYGNAVVPQIPELIGRAIMQAEGMIACESDAA